MLTILTIGVVVFVGLVTLFQASYTAIYHRFIQQGLKERRGDSSDEQSHVAVILCLRGIDPALKHCLSSLAAQSRQNWSLHLVFDHESDPAITPARNWCNDLALQPVVHFVEHSAFSAGTLKCHALVTAIDRIHEESEFIALIDADSIVDQHWLRDLLAPFSDPSVGATTGNRWFEPETGSNGSLVRQIWSAAAVVQMYIYNIAWGGSLVVRSSAIGKCKLLQKWSTAFCEDTMLSSELKKHGYRLQRIPDVIALNRETTSLHDAFRWISRQLLTVRLHHAGWPMVLIHGISIGLCLVAVPALLVAAIVVQQWSLVWVLLGTAAFFPIANSLIIKVINSANRAVVLERFENESSQSPAGPVTYFMAIMLTQFIQPVAALITAVASRATWRGIEYSIKKGSVQMAEYLPYKQAQPDDDSGRESVF
ncbi:MAG: glycosyltransferase family 2 protein [Planctomycetota bacterium]